MAEKAKPLASLLEAECGRSSGRFLQVWLCANLLRRAATSPRHSQGGPGLVGRRLGWELRCAYSTRLNGETIALRFVEQLVSALLGCDVFSRIKHAPSLVTELHRACEGAHSQRVRLATPA